MPHNALLLRRVLALILLAGCAAGPRPIAMTGTTAPVVHAAGTPGGAAFHEPLPTTTTTVSRAVPALAGDRTGTANTGMGPGQYQAGPGWGPGTLNGYDCGGSLPPCCVMAGESGGNPTAENPYSTASGLWQVLDGTWNGWGGYTHASYAPASVQQDQARHLFAGGAGAGHWAATIGCAG